MKQIKIYHYRGLEEFYGYKKAQSILWSKRHKVIDDIINQGANVMFRKMPNFEDNKLAYIIYVDEGRFEQR